MSKSSAETQTDQPTVLQVVIASLLLGVVVGLLQRDVGWSPPKSSDGGHPAVAKTVLHTAATPNVADLPKRAVVGRRYIELSVRFAPLISGHDMGFRFKGVSFWLSISPFLPCVRACLFLPSSPFLCIYCYATLMLLDVYADIRNRWCDAMLKVSLPSKISDGLRDRCEKLRSSCIDDPEWMRTNHPLLLAGLWRQCTGESPVVGMVRPFLRFLLSSVCTTECTYEHKLFGVLFTISVTHVSPLIRHSCSTPSRLIS